MTARKYVDRYSSFDVVSGTIVEVKGLQVAAQDHLDDGVVTVIGRDGCRVTVRHGNETVVYEVGPETLLVTAPDVDYIIRPNGSSAGVNREGAEIAAGAKAAAETQSLMKASNRVLDLLPVLSEEEVRREINRLALSFETHKDVAGIRALLLSRLERRMGRGSVVDSESPGPKADETAEKKEKTEGQPSQDPASARELLVRAKALLEEDKKPEAVPLLEQAYAADPENSEVAATLAKLLKDLGLDFYSRGKWDEAISYWQRVIGLFPDDEEARRFLKRAREVKKKM